MASSQTPRVSPGRHLRPQSGEEIIAAMRSILSKVRARVRDDFLILTNSGRSKLTAYTAYVNGTFMETTRDHPDGYTHGELVEIESTLLWSEKNLRAPQINCLGGVGYRKPSPGQSRQPTMDAPLHHHEPHPL